jgi:hypothetical protein
MQIFVYALGALLMTMFILILLILGFVVGHDDGNTNKEEAAAAGRAVADPVGWTYSQVYDATGTLCPGPKIDHAHVARAPPSWRTDPRAALARQGPRCRDLRDGRTPTPTARAAARARLTSRRAPTRCSAQAANWASRWDTLATAPSA